MEERLYRLNRIYAIVDTLICIVAVAAFTFCAWWFEHWWISLGNVLVIALYNQHTILIDAAINQETENKDGV